MRSKFEVKGRNSKSTHVVLSSYNTFLKRRIGYNKNWKRNKVLPAAAHCTRDIETLKLREEKLPKGFDAGTAHRYREALIWHVK